MCSRFHFGDICADHESLMYTSFRPSAPEIPDLKLLRIETREDEEDAKDSLLRNRHIHSPAAVPLPSGNQDLYGRTTHKKPSGSKASQLKELAVR